MGRASRIAGASRSEPGCCYKPRGPMDGCHWLEPLLCFVIRKLVLLARKTVNLTVVDLGLHDKTRDNLRGGVLVVAT